MSEISLDFSSKASVVVLSAISERSSSASVVLREIRLLLTARLPCAYTRIEHCTAQASST